MQINENIKIETVDNRNICILKKQLGDGKEKWKRLGYYSTPQGALKGLVKMEIEGTGLRDFKIICSKINELYKYIDSLNMEMPKKDELMDFLGE